MTAIHEWYVYTGNNASTETAASNINWMSTDAYDSSGTDYQTNRIEIPSSGTNYSFEKHIRAKFSGTYNAIENCIMWHSSGSLSDVNLDLTAGVTDTGVTPTDSASIIATNSLVDWDSEVEALDVQNGTMESSPDYSKYLVVQVKVPSTVTTTGDIGAQTVTNQYDES